MPIWAVGEAHVWIMSVLSFSVVLRVFSMKRKEATTKSWISAARGVSTRFAGVNPGSGWRMRRGLMNRAIGCENLSSAEKSCEGCGNSSKFDHLMYEMINL